MDNLGQEINSSLVDGRLPCPVAFNVAKRANVPLKAVGEKTDEVGIRISNCQLGCFGAKKATHEELVGMPLDENVAAAVREALVDGGLPCAGAHEVARKLKVSRKKVGDTATQMKIHVVQCQLGCF